MDRFSKFHPFVCFSFFAGVITVTILFTNSFFTALSLFGAFLYSVKLQGRKAVVFFMKYIIPIVLFAAFFNMLFVRYGKHILFIVKGINFTQEGFLSGLLTGVMIGAVMLWFFCYNRVITSDKFMALFGGIAPNTALLFSMILRFLPLMAQTAEEIKTSNKGMGIAEKGLRDAVNRFSALISISLEKSIETADSMRARGFGKKKKRGFYSAFAFRFSDAAAALFMITVVILIIAFSVSDYPYILLNPGIHIQNHNLAILALFGVFSVFPTAVDLTEEAKWLLLKSKI